MSRRQDRLLAIQMAHQWIADRPVYLDCETTGLDETAEIIDICILEHDGRVLVDSLVQPTRPIPPEAAQVHGITNTVVRRAPTWAVVWPEVRAALSGRQVAIYNASYDIRLMWQSHRVHRIVWSDSDIRSVCIMKLYAQYHGEWSNLHRSYRWRKLEQAGRDLGIRLPNAHRAREDALLARAVLHAIANGG